MVLWFKSPIPDAVNAKEAEAAAERRLAAATGGLAAAAGVLATEEVKIANDSVSFNLSKDCSPMVNNQLEQIK